MSRPPLTDLQALLKRNGNIRSNRRQKLRDIYELQESAIWFLSSQKISKMHNLLKIKAFLSSQKIPSHRNDDKGVS